MREIECLVQEKFNLVLKKETVFAFFGNFYPAYFQCTEPKTTIFVRISYMNKIVDRNIHEKMPAGSFEKMSLILVHLRFIRVIFLAIAD